ANPTSARVISSRTGASVPSRDTMPRVSSASPAATTSIGCPCPSTRSAPSVIKPGGPVNQQPVNQRPADRQPADRLASQPAKRTTEHPTRRKIIYQKKGEK